MSDIIIPDLPILKFPELNMKPVLNQISEDNEIFTLSVKKCNEKKAKMIIHNYDMSKNNFLDELFKMYEDDYDELRNVLKKYVEQRKKFLEKALKNL
jgi:hypothetical protein